MSKEIAVSWWVGQQNLNRLARQVRMITATEAVVTAIELSHPDSTEKDYVFDQSGELFRQSQKTHVIKSKPSLILKNAQVLPDDTPEITLTPGGKPHSSPNERPEWWGEVKNWLAIIAAIDALDESLRNPDNPWSCPMCGLNWSDGGGVEGRNMHFPSCPLKALFDARNRLAKCD